MDLEERIVRDDLGRRNVYFKLSDLPRYRQLEMRAEYFMNMWFDQVLSPLPQYAENMQALRAAAMYYDMLEKLRERG